MRSRGGYSLVELLIALALTALLAAATLGAFTVGHRALKEFTLGLDERQQLRMAIKMMTDDLSLAHGIAFRRAGCHQSQKLPCQLEAKVYQPTELSKANRTGVVWADLTGWPGDLREAKEMTITYGIAGLDEIEEAEEEFDAEGEEGGTVACEQPGTGRLIRQISDNTRVYSSRVLLSNLKTFNRPGGSTFRSENDYLATVLLVLPTAGAGGCADAAQVSTVFHLRPPAPS